MKRILKILLVLVLTLLAVPLTAILGVVGKYQSIVRKTPALETRTEPGPRTAQVDPFIATGGWPWMSGLNTPAAQVPFGMVRLGPDTESFINNERCLNRSGYYYGDDKLIGFSHTRLVGADSKEGGVFRVFPTKESRLEQTSRKDRFTKFSHTKERAFPGYYAVWLPQEQVLAELTASAHGGIHRYTFQDMSKPGHVLIDASSILAGRTRDTAISIHPETAEVTGTNTIHGSFSGRYDGLTVYFAARFSPPFHAYGVWQGDAFTASGTEASGEDCGADLTVTAPPGAGVELRVAISYVSIDNARENLEKELEGQSFEDIAAASRDAWEARLNTIQITGGTERQQRIFNTAMYRAFQMPSLFTDVNGEFRGFDKEVHRAEGYTYYSDFSLWDTFRAAHPLYNLIARKETSDFMKSLVEMAREGGCLPRWPSGCGYTNCMFGTPADIAVSEAWLKGIRDFDVDFAYACMRQTALEGKPAWSKFAGREGLEHHLQYHYLPSDKENDSVAATLEYAWCDTALAGLATALGKTEDAAIFADHAKWYQNLFNPASTYFEPKDSAGAFSSTIKPTLLTYLDFDRNYTKDYVEGSAEQWRFAVPYDAEGLVSLFPSKEKFVDALEEFFEGSTSGVGHWNPGGYYWHGNEPYIHSAYLFNSAGRPDLTQKWVRWIMERKYDDTYYGLDGNDDGGTLSSWYVFSALGFYPIAGTTRYWLGSPLFDSAEVDIAGNTLKIVAENNSDDNVYVTAVTLNGQPLREPWFTHEQIAHGGELRFTMSAKPKTEGATP